MAYQENYLKQLERSRPNENLTKLPPLGLKAGDIAADFKHYFCSHARPGWKP